MGVMLLYDELDAQGAVVRAGFALGMRDVLSDGHQWVPHSGPSKQELIAATLAQARALRMDIFKILDGLQASALTTGNTSLALAIETSKQALRDITAIDLSPCNTAEEMQSAIYAAYLAVAMAAPAAIQSAFAQMVGA